MTAMDLMGADRSTPHSLRECCAPRRSRGLRWRRSAPLLACAAAAFVGALVAGCGGDSPPGRTFYERNIEPILIQKCAGNTSGWAFDCAQRGYTSWGYFYEADSANYATYAPRWSILGVDYNASQSAWDALRAAASYRPVMAHICPNAAAVTTAQSRGANGFMVSGVIAVKPPLTTQVIPWAIYPSYQNSAASVWLGT